MNTRVLRKHVRWFVFVLGVCLLSSRAARAEPTAMDRAAAQALFDEAVTLLDRGEAGPACPKLEESQRLDPGVGTLLYLAACYEKLGRTASAWATFTEAAYAAKRVGQVDREAIALDNATRLKPLLARLVVEVTPQETEGITVSRDDEPLSQAMWGSEIPVDPGQRTVTASAPGKQTWTGTVEVPAQGLGRIQVPVLLDAVAEPSILPPPRNEAAPPPQVSSTRARDEDPGASQRLWGWVGIGAGSAIIVGGGVFAFLAVTDNGRADDACRRDDPTVCSERGVELGDSAQSKANVASVLGGVGAAVAITGAVLLFTAPDGSEQARLTFAPSWSNQASGVRLQGSF